MLNAQSLSETKEIESKQKDIDIVVDDESLFQISFELPSADTIKTIHCKPAHGISVSEISTQDPFNFRELFQKEFINLTKKHDKYKDSSSFILKLSGVATLSGNIDKAEALLSDSIKGNDNPALLHKLGDTFILQGLNEKALEVFSQADLQADIYSNLRLAYIYTKQNNLKKAFEHLDTAQRIDPTDFRPQLFLGLVHLKTGQCEKAIRNFRVAAATKKDSSSLHVNLAAAHWSLGHTDKTIKELKQAISINPLNENALVFYSDVMFNLDYNDKTIQPLEFFVKLNSSSKFAWERLARAYYFTGKYTKAKHALDNLISISDEPYTYNNLGVVYWQMREHKAALKCLFEAIEKSGDDSKQISIPLLNMAIILNEKRKYQECYNILKTYISNPKSAADDRILSKIEIQYFIALEGTDRHDIAAHELKLFLNRHYSDAEGRLLLLTCKIYSDAVIYKNMNDCYKFTEKLLTVIKERRDEIPENSIRFAYNNIAFNYLLDNKVNDAFVYINKNFKYVYTDAYCTATYGLYNIKKGNLQVGIKLYETAISLATTKDIKDKIRQRLNLELGKYALSSGNTKEAMRYFTKASGENNGYKYVTKEAIELFKSTQQISN